jgi:Reverse transcriptase (RNA-dependent DNA polymerase)
VRSYPDRHVRSYPDSTQLKTGTFWPLPVRQRMIPKPGGSGKLRKLGIPTIADRVVQAALKLVLEPIFEADFLPVSYGFRPQRRAYDAVADIHRLGTQGYHWVLDADIEACFDMIDHTVLLDPGPGQGEGQTGRGVGESLLEGRDYDRDRALGGVRHRHPTRRHLVPAAGQHRALRAR